LTRPLDQHLDADEIEALISAGVLGVASPRDSSGALRECERHLEACQAGLRTVQMHRSAQDRISGLAAAKSARGPDCLDERMWLNVAAGLEPKGATGKLLRHASECGHCGQLLEEAVKILAEDATPEEETMVANLPSAGAEWRQKIASTLADVGQRPERATSAWKALFVWPRLAFASVGIALLALAGWLTYRQLRPPSVDQLLAQAYTERRTMEVRIPGAKRAPIRVERSAPGSSFEKGNSLLKAEAMISDRLRQNANDPLWVEYKGRAELLDGSYDEAIKTLLRALESRPDSPELLTDLGTAYFLRGKSGDRPVDFSNAIESFGKALAKNPDSPIALFNRALACEELFLYTAAINDWEQYLRIDPHGEWSDEARERLAEVKEKQLRREKSMAEPLLTPLEIASGPDTTALAGWRLWDRAGGTKRNPPGAS
jgi:tetratricopeptide (TPR) repeat protein